jgi:hypothetical protein
VAVKTENQVKQEITDYLELRGYKVHRMNSGLVRVRGGVMHLCEKDTPDLLVLGKNNFVLWIETKKPGEKASPGQLAKLKYYQTLGHLTIVADCLDDVISLFDF